MIEAVKIVSYPTQEDLVEIARWLKEEHVRDDSGFWCNWRVIQSAYADGELTVVKLEGRAVAFSVGEYGCTIFCVQQEFQKAGIGTILSQHFLAKARADGVPVLRMECSPQTSLSYWQKHGFRQYGESPMYGNPEVALMLDYHWPLPADGKPCAVVVTQYPESAIYGQPTRPAPVLITQPPAMRDADGIIQLSHRITIPWHLAERNAVISIQVDGDEIYFGKAKWPDATDLGVQSYMSDFFIDRLYLPQR